MSVFTIISLRASPDLGELIKEKFSDNIDVIPNNVWFVGSSDTAIDIATALGAGREATRSGVIVIRCAPAYFGRANSTLWD
jgi:hypothetical protein